MSDIRKCFKSRFGSHGALVELDYSQLEIYTLAVLSHCHQLKADLLSGKDLHGISAEALFGPGYSPKERKIAKQLSFQLQYGAGAKSMAESNGITVGLAKKFIQNYYERYPEVRVYQDAVMSAVKTSRKISPKRTKKGIPAGQGVWVGVTGRRYTFTEVDAPEWSRSGDPTFSPTQLKNYTIQGTATADIVPMMLGKVYRYIKSKEEFDDVLLLVNTVHDSIVLDVDTRFVKRTDLIDIQNIMEQVPEAMKEVFDFEWDLPSPVDIEVGKDWYTMESIDITDLI